MLDTFLDIVIISVVVLCMGLVAVVMLIGNILVGISYAVISSFSNDL